MTDIEEEGDAILKDIERGYRFRWQFQLILVGIIIGVLVIALFELHRQNIINIGLYPSALIIIWVLAFIWPIFIKTRNRLYSATCMGLFFAAISSFIVFLIYIYFITSAYLPSTPLLLVAFCVGIGAQLFEHLNPRIIKNNIWGYITIGILSSIFAICTYFFLYALWGIPGIYICVVLSALFVWSLIPEEPY
ncbi:MAG: hypothetical protein ACTSPQ_12665 [Candidatus Helarchaeota archaeon]